MNSREKGKRRERELAAALRELGFPGARRSAQYCGTAGDADIADAIPGVHIESKGVEKLNLRAAMAQAKEDAAKHRLAPMVMNLQVRDERSAWLAANPPIIDYGPSIPCVMHKTKNKPWLVTLNLSDLMSFCAAVQAAYQGKPKEQPCES